MRISLGRPLEEERRKLEEAFRRWADNQDAGFLANCVLTVPGLDSHSPDALVQLGGEQYLVVFETCHSLDHPHTRSRWTTFWAQASRTPGLGLMLVLPESSDSPEGRPITNLQITTSLHALLNGIEGDLAERGVILDRSKLKFVFV